MAKTFVGIVSSDKNDKTIVVNIQSQKTHPLYKKQYSVTKKFLVHDEKNEAISGDKVMIREIKPASARKRHMLEKILERPTIREEQSVTAITAEPEPKEVTKPEPKKVVKPKTAVKKEESK